MTTPTPTFIATTAPTQFLDVGDTRLAYRRFGNPAATPVVFTQHLMGNLDNFDPRSATPWPPAARLFARRVIDFLDIQPHDNID